MWAMFTEDDRNQDSWRARFSSWHRPLKGRTKPLGSIALPDPLHCSPFDRGSV
jgi:hypothetical protein